MQELCNSIIEFFSLVIEKYVTHFANPMREWTYFKTMLQQDTLDISRIQSYLRVLKTNQEQMPTPQLRIEIPKMETPLQFVSPLQEHNRPIEHVTVEQVKQVKQVKQLTHNNMEQLKQITEHIVNTMKDNNIQLAMNTCFTRTFERRFSDTTEIRFQL